MTLIDVVIGADSLEVELDIRCAPSVTAALLTAVPHDTVAVHAQTAGAEFCVPVPFFHWHENRREPQTGDVGYASFGNYVCFYYGAMSEADGPTNVIGRVRDLDVLTRVGQALLTTGGARARLLSNGATLLPTVNATEEASAFEMACGGLLAAALGDTPPAVAELTGKRIPAMGALAGRLQAGGFLMGLAETLFLLRTHAVDRSADPSLLAKMLTGELARYGRWLEMSGMTSVTQLLYEVASAVPPEITVRELASGLETLLVAVSRLRLWVEAISPWHVLQERLGTEDWLAPSLCEN